MKVPMKKDFAKLFGIQKTSAGFTLIELLVAMSLTTIVVSVAGFGLVTIMGANNKGEAETQRRVNLNRALDFIADEVRMASSVRDSATAPSWATDSDNTNPANSASDWIENLGGGSPNAKLYIQIPLTLESMTAGNPITVRKHGFSNGNAVMFTGSGTVSSPLSKNTVYYVRDATQDTFNVSTSLGGAVTTLTTNSSGSLIANRLLIYYIRDNTSTWLPPKTINRSAGPCLNSYEESNCPALVDSVAANGFTATATSSRQAQLNLGGKLSDTSTETYEVSTKAFARSATLAAAAPPAAPPVIPTGPVTPTIPTIPTGFTVANPIHVSGSGTNRNYTVAITWSPVTGATSYQLYRCGPGGSQCTPTTSDTLVSDSSATLATDTFTTENNKDVCYVVRAINAGGSSSLSTPTCKKT